MSGRVLSVFLAGSWAMPAAGVAALALLYFFSVFCCVLGRLRLYRRPLEAPLITDDGPAIGELIPTSIRAAVARQLPSRAPVRTVLLFAAPGCAPCADLLPHIDAAARRWRRETQLLVVLATDGVWRSHPALKAWARLRVPVLADETGSFSDALTVRHRPFGLLLDRRGVVLMKGVVSTGAQLDALVEEWGVAQGRRDWKTEVAAGVA